jgi:hypothetical protein
MSHEEAADMNAVEMYVLKDLTPDEERRFEEHYFTCQECACGVAVEQALVTHAGVATARQSWWRRWAFPVLTPVTAALLGLVAFQGVELSKLDKPLPNTDVLAEPLVKSATEKSKSIATASVTIEVNLPDEAPPFPFYRLVLLGEGKAPVSQVLPAPEGSRLSMQVLSRTLSSGSYNVSVFGLPKHDAQDGSRLGQYSFQIQLR